MSDRLHLTRDGRLLFLARSVRMFAYGLVSIVLMFYLTAAGLSPREQGLLITLTLLGDTVITLWLSTRADRFGRRRTLIVGAVLMLMAGLVFSLSTGFVVLLLAATIGVISPNGTEVGPFLSIEQAALSEIAPPGRRTTIYAWYHVFGISASALGALTGGEAVAWARACGLTGVDAYRPVLWVYALAGVAIAITSAALAPAVEAPPTSSECDAAVPTRWGLHRSRRTVGQLSLLFALDAFGGGFILQAIMAYWLHLQFDVDEAQLGKVFFAANLLSGASALLAGRLASRFGLINTMVFTHLPSNVLLVLLPVMPNVRWAVALLMVRYSISQMDVPTRQAYIMAVVAPDERSAAAGVTSVARSIGASASPLLARMLISNPALAALPLFLAGGIKIVYDLILFSMFSSRREEIENR